MINIGKSRSFKWSVTTSTMLIIAYIITWRFYAMWWFLIVFLDLIVFLFYLIVFLGSIIFSIRNQKKFDKPFVPLFINMAAILILIFGPSIYRNKSYFKNTTDLSHYQGNSCECHLYIETYCVYGGGALSTNVNSLYLTDSLSFRLYEGTYDEGDGAIVTTCKGDNISVEKYAHETLGQNSGELRTIEKKTYSLKDLKDSHISD